MGRKLPKLTPAPGVMVPPRWRMSRSPAAAVASPSPPVPHSPLQVPPPKLDGEGEDGHGREQPPTGATPRSLQVQVEDGAVATAAMTVGAGGDCMIPAAPEPTSRPTSPEPVEDPETDPETETPEYTISTNMDDHDELCRYYQLLDRRVSFIKPSDLEDIFYENKIPARKTVRENTSIYHKNYPIDEFNKRLRREKEKASKGVRTRIRKKLELPYLQEYVRACWRVYVEQEAICRELCFCPDARISIRPGDVEEEEIGDRDRRGASDVDGDVEGTDAEDEENVETEPEEVDVETDMETEVDTDSEQPPLKKLKLTQKQHEIAAQYGVDLSESESEPDTDLEEMEVCVAGPKSPEGIKDLKAEVEVEVKSQCQDGDDDGGEDDDGSLLPSIIFVGGSGQSPARILTPRSTPVKPRTVSDGGTRDENDMPSDPASSVVEASASRKILNPTPSDLELGKVEIETDDSNPPILEPQVVHSPGWTVNSVNSQRVHNSEDDDTDVETSLSLEFHSARNSDFELEPMDDQEDPASPASASDGMPSLLISGVEESTDAATPSPSPAEGKRRRRPEAFSSGDDDMPPLLTLCVAAAEFEARSREEEAHRRHQNLEEDGTGVGAGAVIKVQVAVEKNEVKEVGMPVPNVNLESKLKPEVVGDGSTPTPPPPEPLHTGDKWKLAKAELFVGPCRRRLEL